MSFYIFFMGVSNMGNYLQSRREECEYLKLVIDLIKTELKRKKELLSDKKARLIASRKDMWEDTVHFSNDFSRLTEINQYLTEVNNRTMDYSNTSRMVERYEKMLKSPYFGRFDFLEDGSHNAEKIYIGLHSLIDPETRSILVYDWRAPISSIFYRYEPGEASYDSPSGRVSGKVLLKRQYKIQNSRLEYFFDCSVRINDEMLQEVLSHNASARMRSIVESIQKEQDLVIRDTDNEVLIVQGVAGSGKTSVALHRIAYLVYEGLRSGLRSNNILIISPNAVFSKYISSVLPELGEENVEQIVFEDYVRENLDGKVLVETRNSQLECLVSGGPATDIKKQAAIFKGSDVFAKILDRLVHHCERHMIPFEDIYYHGKTVESGQSLRNIFLNNKINMPIAGRLKRIENIITEKLKPLQKARIREIEKAVQKMDGHDFEIKQYSRLLSRKESKAFVRRMKKFTEIDYYSLYSRLFNDMKLFYKLASGLKLSQDIQQIISMTKESLSRQHVSHEDCAPLMYLKLRIEGPDLFSEIRHVVIDEAQDYSPVQYEVFRLLFRNADFTILGDVNQSIAEDVDQSLYDSLVGILNKNRWLKVTLNKSYRSSYEIFSFAQKLLKRNQEAVPFERHEAKPVVSFKKTSEEMGQAVVKDIEAFMGQGLSTIGVLCKTARESEKVYNRLVKATSIKLVNSNDAEVEKGAVVMPVYMAKGLEFDAVIIYNVSEDNYSSELDRKLLYIACTRALHRLNLHYTGSLSPIIPVPA
jgi:DNA helicase-2/ATP-dependent DNA helicase PcrA